MEALLEHIFHGEWKSYKTFYSTGKVEKNTLQSFLLFCFGENRTLEITVYSIHTVPYRMKIKTWSVDFNNKRHFLNVNDNAARYEVITIDHSDMVLRDMKTDSKYFFVKSNAWQMLIK